MKLPVTLKNISESNFSGTRDIHYPGNISASGQTALSNGEIIFSDVSDVSLSSQDYRNCFGIAGLSPTRKKVLAHICPGTLSEKAFSTVFLRNTRDEIARILDTWVEHGSFTHNEQIGIFGSCIFQKNPRNYIESLEILYALLEKALPGEPQILAAPVGARGFQHAKVADDGVTIYKTTQGVKFPQETYFSLKQIRGRVNLLTS